MKLYVDKLPKTCFECRYFYHECKNIYHCAMQNNNFELYDDDYIKRNKDCPLQLIDNLNENKLKRDLTKDFNDKQKKLYAALVELWHLLGMGNREIQAVLNQVSQEIDALYEL